jgi:hypothetical protein
VISNGLLAAAVRPALLAPLKIVWAFAPVRARFPVNPLDCSVGVAGGGEAEFLALVAVITDQGKLWIDLVGNAV